METSKRRRPENKDSSSVAFIQSLPKQLLIKEVVARVASHSLIDLFNFKKVCKEFLHASEDGYVYQHVCLDNFPLVQWFPNEKALSFLKLCKESKNMEALYREGLLEYFNYVNGNNGGLQILKQTAQNGHMEAKYVYGMIALCSEDNELRKEGLEHVRFVRKSKCVIKCRNRVKTLMESLWKSNIMLVRNPETLCNNNTTCRGYRPKEGRWTLLDDEDDDYDDINMCEYCRWDQELDFFYGLLNVD